MSHPAFDTLLAELRALHASKSHDYSYDDPLSNYRRASRLGVTPSVGVLVRASDKWSRIESLVSGKSPKHESLRDSLIDLCVHTLNAIILLDEERQYHDTRAQEIDMSRP